MRGYRVGYEGKWQASFRKLDEAMRYAAETQSSTGRPVFVVHERRFSRAPRFVAAFPRVQEEKLRALWEASRIGSTPAEGLG
jgi:hypothetical protein